MKFSSTYASRYMYLVSSTPGIKENLGKYVLIVLFKKFLRTYTYLCLRTYISRCFYENIFIHVIYPFHDFLKLIIIREHKNC